MRRRLYQLRDFPTNLDRSCGKTLSLLHKLKSGPKSYRTILQFFFDGPVTKTGGRI